jgi:hypothetical protein
MATAAQISNRRLFPTIYPSKAFLLLAAVLFTEICDGLTCSAASLLTRSVVVMVAAAQTSEQHTFPHLSNQIIV